MIRIPERLVTSILMDLARPHPIAHERVGFLFGGIGTTAEGQRLFLAKRYHPVADDHYLPTKDPRVGAAIGERAIRGAREESMSTGDGIMHVHQHLWCGDPGVSKVDREGYEAMIPSFVPMAPRAAHGALIFSIDNATALVRWPGSKAMVQSNVTVIGFPMRFWGNA